MRCNVLPGDATPPTVIGVADRAANAAGWYKAPVTIDWQATDDSGSAADPLDTVAATEGANVLYKSGSTCDPSGNCGFGTLLVSIDLTAPTITTSGTTMADATSPNGVNVSYTATANDVLDPAPQLSCLPASGSLFAIGTTTVNCTASDRAGNTSTRTFVVEVRGASPQIVSLAQKTLAFLDLPALAQSLGMQLQAVANAVVANNRRLACAALNIYIAVVRVAPPSAFTAGEKSGLVADATRIRAVVGC